MYLGVIHIIGINSQTYDVKSDFTVKRENKLQPSNRGGWKATLVLQSICWLGSGCLRTEVGPFLAGKSSIRISRCLILGRWRWVPMRSQYECLLLRTEIISCQGETLLHTPVGAWQLLLRCLSLPQFQNSDRFGVGIPVLCSRVGIG